MTEWTGPEGLAELAARINAAFARFRDRTAADRQRVLAAWEAGDLLLQAESRLPYEAWTDWLWENCPEVPPMWALRLMGRANYAASKGRRRPEGETLQ
jgi:hypothetical protein